MAKLFCVVVRMLARNSASRNASKRVKAASGPSIGRLLIARYSRFGSGSVGAGIGVGTVNALMAYQKRVCSRLSQRRVVSPPMPAQMFGGALLESFVF